MRKLYIYTKMLDLLNKNRILNTKYDMLFKTNYMILTFGVRLVFSNWMQIIWYLILVFLVLLFIYIYMIILLAAYKIWKLKTHEKENSEFSFCP